MSGAAVIRPAKSADMAELAALIRELAAYEKLEAAAVATPSALEAGLLGAQASAWALMVEMDGKAVGFAVYFRTFSTFTGRPSLYVEDIFIRPEFRRRGLGKKVFRQLAEMAVEAGCGRMEWSVLDWNTPALEFYASLGAKPMDEWTVQRLTGQALIDFAKAKE